VDVSLRLLSSDSVAVAPEADNFSVIDQALNDGCGCRGIAEDVAPSAEGPIGRQDDGTTFISTGDHLEEEIGSLLLKGCVAQLIDDQDLGPVQAPQGL